MTISKLKVIGTETTLSGSYLMYIYNNEGGVAMRQNYVNAKKGDELEIWESEIGGYPEKIFVNGVEVWNEKNKKEYEDAQERIYKQRHEDLRTGKFWEDKKKQNQ